MLARRGTKRARSSSPTSSPANEKTTTLPRANVKKLANALKSPHADPTLELWDRFSMTVKENQVVASGIIANPALADLMVSSSPRPMKGALGTRNEPGLRRTVSCGVHVPKRRRLEKPKSGSQGSRGQRDLEAASKSSLVTALLDTVTSSMQDLSQDDILPSLQESPSPKKRETNPPDYLLSQTISGSTTKPGLDDEVSDYGDDDFDEETFMQLEASLDVPPSNTNDASVQPSCSTAPQPQENRASTILEEFDDLDDGFFEDTEDLVPNAGTASTEKSGDNASITTQRKHADFEDDFDDDFAADIDFEAVEFAATQSVKQQAVNVGANVCSAFAV